MSAHTIISTLPLRKFPPPQDKMSGKHPSQKKNSTPPPPTTSLTPSNSRDRVKTCF